MKYAVRNYAKTRRARPSAVAGIVAALALSACSDDDAAEGIATDASADGGTSSDATRQDSALPATDGGSKADNSMQQEAGEVPDAVPDAAAFDAIAPNSADAARDAATIDGPLEGNAADAETFGGSLLVATTNLVATEIHTIDLGQRTVSGPATIPDSDAVLKISDGRRFVLERGNDRVKLLGPTGAITTFDLANDATPRQNPHDVVVVPSTSTAFVPLYKTGHIAVLDITTGTVSGDIDLSSFVGPGDPDGSPDIDSGVFVPSTGLVYFALQRININTWPIACPTVPSVLVAIDPTTKTVVDANGVKSGKAIELDFISPSNLTYDAPTDRILILANGCDEPTTDGGARRAYHGIEAVSPKTGYTHIIYSPSAPDFLSQLVLLQGTSALINSFDSNGAEQWNRWDLTSATLGPALHEVPAGATRETADTLLGVSKAVNADGGFAGYDVIRYRISTGVSSVVVHNPAAAPYSYVSRSALVP